MRGLDSNVLLRLLLADEPRQYEIARDLLSRFVSWIVLCEVVWVLSRAERFSRETIAGVIEGLLDAPEIRVEKEDLVALAVNVYTKSGADLADVLIGLSAAAAGCSETVTFDREAAATGYLTLIG
jgi:predicted nucleic-acid-binding protein